MEPREKPITEAESHEEEHIIENPKENLITKELEEDH